MKREKLAAVFLAAAAVLAFAVSAGAVDGTIEINQAKVLAGSGFPYVISNPGSYRLTGNLTVSGTADAIDLFATNVTIDLNGFSITGAGGVSGGAGVNSFTNGSVTVENGTITGFTGQAAIEMGINGIVKNVRATGNNFGITGGAGSLISGNTINGNSIGLNCPSTCGWGGNVLTGNGTDVIGGATSMGNNVCHTGLC